MTNSWATRIGILAILLFVYGAGYAGGRDQALQNYQNQSVCNSNLKP
jgi:hypothetical protein